MEASNNNLARAADALTADLNAGEPGPWPAAVWTSLHALVRQAPAQLAHMGMHYRCDRCEFEWLVYLTIGLEGPEALKLGGLSLPVPFIIGCPRWHEPKDPEKDPAGYTACGGSMQHVDWSRDPVFEPLVLIPDDAARFVLPDAAPGDDPPCGHLAMPTAALVRGRRGEGEAA